MRGSGGTGGAHHKAVKPSRAHQVVGEQLESEADQEQQLVRRMVPAAAMAAAMAAAVA